MNGPHRIETPRGTIVVTKNGTARLTFRKNFGRNWTNGFNKTQAYIDNEVLRLCDKKVPMRTGMLKKSGILGTIVGSGVVQYIAIYAWKQYLQNKGTGQRGKLWFKRMKAESGAAIARGAALFMKKNGGSQ